jgi:hypothetical protein
MIDSLTYYNDQSLAQGTIHWLCIRFKIDQAAHLGWEREFSQLGLDTAPFFRKRNINSPVDPLSSFFDLFFGEDRRSSKTP